jgi:hypothetical protein
MKIDNQIIAGLSYEDDSPKKYKLVREHDGLINAGNKILWIDWKKNGIFKKSHDKPKINRSLILDPYLGSYTWMTTVLTEIIEQREDYIKFRTSNSIYELFIQN